ncbi:RYamide receptor-like [Lineus longissimus]|uniref:RYamide receptor-like n=1 Tax=Lineus longissimus TaxID=88925 RepID=UPI00315DBEEC
MENVTVSYGDGSVGHFQSFADWQKHKAEVADDGPSTGIHSGAQVALIALYAFSAFFAIVGNSIIIAVVFIRKRTAKTNWNVFFMNLALTDILMACFCIPFTFTQVMLGEWVLGEIMCPLTLFTQVLTVSVSIISNTAIGIERYRAVIHPLEPRVNTTKVRLSVFFIWVACAVVSLPQLVVGRVTQAITSDGQPVLSCNERWPNQDYRKAYTVVMLFLTYIIPLIILAVSYSIIGATLWERKTPGNANTARDEKQVEDKKKVIKMLMTIVIVFGCLWLPIHIINMILDFIPSLFDAIPVNVFLGIYLACHWLAMSNSFTNVLIYWALNDSFRYDCKVLWHVHIRKRHLRSGSTLNQFEFSRNPTFQRQSITTNAGSSIRLGNTKNNGSLKSGWKCQSSDEESLTSSTPRTPISPHNRERMTFTFGQVDPIIEVSSTFNSSE